MRPRDRSVVQIFTTTAAKTKTSMRPLLLPFLLCSTTLSAQSNCDSLKTLLGSMLEQYNALSVENEQIAFEMNVQRAQIDSLRAALNRGTYDLDKAMKEAKVLRSIMSGYVLTIDSLNSTNKVLEGTIEERNGQGK